jgi:cytochrome c556
MRRLLGVMTVLGLCLLWGLGRAAAHEHDHGHAEKLPPGPIHDRHELMEGIGEHAKKIGAAIKADDKKAVAPEADAIAAKAEKITGLFPEGSTHPHSRAKPEIWQDWKKFEAAAAQLHKDALELAKVARAGGDAGAASRQMFGACKSCHDSFRVPDDD